MDNLSMDRENFRNYEKMTGSFILPYKEEHKKRTYQFYHTSINQSNQICMHQVFNQVYMFLYD